MIGILEKANERGRFEKKVVKSYSQFFFCRKSLGKSKNLPPEKRQKINKGQSLWILCNVICYAFRLVSKNARSYVWLVFLPYF